MDLHGEHGHLRADSLKFNILRGLLQLLGEVGYGNGVVVAR
jgi:hypothetical protein